MIPSPQTVEHRAYYPMTQKYNHAFWRGLSSVLMPDYRAKPVPTKLTAPDIDQKPQGIIYNNFGVVPLDRFY